MRYFMASISVANRPGRFFGQQAPAAEQQGRGRSAERAPAEQSRQMSFECSRCIDTL